MIRRLLRARLRGLLTVAALAGGAAACPGDRDLAFLRSLNEESQYGLAALQGELLLRESERDTACAESEGLRLEAGRALYHLGEFGRVRAAFRTRAAGDPSYRRYYLESHFLELERPDLADSALAFLGGPGAAVPVAELRLYEAAARYLRGDLAAARAAWPAPAGSGEDPGRYLDLGYQRPAVAALLSVFPGGGYFYAGQAADGWTALAAACILYGAAGWYLGHDAPVRGGMAAALGGVFHLSGIYGGHRAARETNRTRKVGFLRALHGRLP